MSKVAITKTKLDNLANAVAAKSGEPILLTVDEMTSAVLSIAPKLQSKTITPAAQQLTVNPDLDYEGLSSVIVESIPSNYVIPSGDCYIDTNGSHNIAGYASVYVDVPTGGTVNNQNKTVTPTTSKQTITADSGYTGLGTVTVNAMPTGTTTAPTSISGTAAVVSPGTNTLTFTKTISVTPRVTTAGYVSTGTAGNSSVSLTASVTTKAAATITPTTTNQTIAAGTYLTGTQTIAGDADLVGSNILSTANIFGVQGTVDFIDVYIRSAAPTSSVGNDGDVYIQE